MAATDPWAEERGLLRYTSDAVIVLDSEARILYASNAADRLTGYPADELLGRSAFDFVHPDEQARVAADLVNRVSELGPGEPAQYRLLHKDGSWHHAEVLGVAYVDEGGTNVAVTLRDVTDRARYEAGLTTSEARFRALVQTSWDIITLHDGEGRVVYASPSIQRTLGYSADQVIGRDVFGLVHPADVEEVLASLARLSSDDAKDADAVQFRIRHSDGSWRWMESVGINRLDDPAIGAVVVTTRDITERKLSSDALARRAAQQEVVADMAHLALRESSLARLFANTASQVAEALDARRVTIAELVGTRLVRVLAVHGTSPEGGKVLTPGREVPWPAGLAGDDDDSRHVSAVIEATDGPYGVLSVDSGGESFDHEDVSFVATVASVLAAAVERHRIQEQLRARALHDPLTGVANRALLADRLDLALHRLNRQGGSLVVLFVDVDGLKAVNDTLGHAAGDDVVRAVAQRLSGVVRSDDTVARFGGDEFVVVCEDTDESTARLLVERIAGVMAEPVTVSGQAVPIRVSVGFAATADAGTPAGTLLARADAAMYEVKGSRRRGAARGRR